MTTRFTVNNPVNNQDSKPQQVLFVNLAHEVDRLTTQSIVDNQVDNQELVVNLDVDFTKLVVDPKSDMLIFFTILQYTSEGQI